MATQPTLRTYRLSADTHVTPFADGAIMITRGDVVAPTVALKLSVAEQIELRALITLIAAGLDKSED